LHAATFIYQMLNGKFIQSIIYLSVSVTRHLPETRTETPLLRTDCWHQLLPFASDCTRWPGTPTLACGWKFWDAFLCSCVMYPLPNGRKYLPLTLRLDYFTCVWKLWILCTYLSMLINNLILTCVLVLPNLVEKTDVYFLHLYEHKY